MHKTKVFLWFCFVNKPRTPERPSCPPLFDIPATKMWAFCDGTGRKRGLFVATSPTACAADTLLALAMGSTAWSHIAEKLHAYTMPRPRPNSRVKDLPDLALLATARELEAGQVRSALEQTFVFRATHELPSTVPAPPDFWHRPYADICREDGLRWTTLSGVTSAVREFLNPVLSRRLDARWLPARWQWETT